MQGYQREPSRDSLLWRCPSGDGTVFKIGSTGKLTTLYNFCSQTNCIDGRYPTSRLVLGANGNFYGATYGGGANQSGSVFEITPNGILTTLYSFCSQTNCNDGSGPGLLGLASSGNFYGVTGAGGAHKGGTDFRNHAGRQTEYALQLLLADQLYGWRAAHRAGTGCRWNVLRYYVPGWRKFLRAGDGFRNYS